VTGAHARGVSVEGFTGHRMRDGAPGLVLGFASLFEDAIAGGVMLLAGAI
jgi:hypothetical protein